MTAAAGINLSSCFMVNPPYCLVSEFLARNLAHIPFVFGFLSCAVVRRRNGVRAEPGAARQDSPHALDLGAGGDLARLKGAASATAPWINQTEVRIQP